jgi:hypothetical protein
MILLLLLVGAFLWLMIGPHLEAREYVAGDDSGCVSSLGFPLLLILLVLAVVVAGLK